MATQLTESVYNRRSSELVRDKRLAVEAYSAAALGASIDETPENLAALREARDRRDEVDELVKSLNAAWEHQQDQDRLAILEAERQKFAATRSRLKELRSECDRIGEEAGAAFDAFLLKFGELSDVRSKMRAELMPWHRSRGSEIGIANVGYGVMEVGKPLAGVAAGLLSRLAKAGLPVDQVAQSAMNFGTTGSAKPLLTGTADEHLDVLEHLAPESVRSLEDA